MTILSDVWAALPTGPDETVTAGELAADGFGSEPFIRRALRVWAEAGWLDVSVEAVSRGLVNCYRKLPGAPVAAPGITAAGEVIDRTPAMTPAEFQVIRSRTGHSLFSLGRALGWTGKRPSVTRAMRGYEDGDRPIDRALAERLRALETRQA